MKILKGFTKVVLSELISEMDEFNGYLEDTEENVGAPKDQLSDIGKMIQVELHENGINTKEKVAEFAKEYLAPLIKRL